MRVFWIFIKPTTRNESEKVGKDKREGAISFVWIDKLHHRPIWIDKVPFNRGDSEGIESEHNSWDPKDGELCLRRMKPEETLVEVRSDTDVQIVR